MRLNWFCSQSKLEESRRFQKQVDDILNGGELVGFFWHLSFVIIGIKYHNICAVQNEEVLASLDPGHMKYAAKSHLRRRAETKMKEAYLLMTNNQYKKAM